MKIAIGCDHGGYDLKMSVMNQLKEDGYEFIDFGCNGESVDYPLIAEKVSKAVLSGECERGFLFCGTGIGMSIAANKFDGIRAAVASDYFSVKFTRLHNNTNVLCFGGRVIGPGPAYEYASLFLRTEFEGGRHQRRVDMITAIEKGEALNR